jgi:hypothetical protein
MRKTARAIVSRWTTALWPATLAGILVGAIIGGLAFQANSAVEATSLIRIYQPIDPDQIMTGAAPSPDSQQNYISGEITYLTSPGFADAVAKQLNETHPLRLSAVQDAKSSIISLSATEANFEQAKRIVDAARTVYSDHVQQQTHERGQAAIYALNAVIARLDAEAQIRDQAQAPNQIQDQQSPIQQLDLQRLAIEAQTQRAAPIQVVQPTTMVPAEGAPSWSLRAVGGGLIGGLLALAGALAWRKRFGVVTSPPALEAHIEHVLLPTVRLGALTESSDAYAGLARSLYAQLPVVRSGRVLLVGASADSGTEDVAGLIAFAAAERGHVRVVHLLDGVKTFDRFESSTDLSDGATVVIDGGSVDTSPALPEAAEDASQIIIVAMIGRDVNDTVRMASQLARNNDVPISAVCTRGTIRSATGSRRNDSHSRHPAADFTVDGDGVPQGSRHEEFGLPLVPTQRPRNGSITPRTSSAGTAATSSMSAGLIRVLRQINRLVAGAVGMRTALGAVLWVGIFAGLGYLAGENIVGISAAFERYKWYVIGALVVIAAIVITRRVRRTRSEKLERAALVGGSPGEHGHLGAGGEHADQYVGADTVGEAGGGWAVGPGRRP